MGYAEQGTESIYWNGYYCFPYIGKSKDSERGWSGNGYMIKESEADPDWFEDVSPKYTTDQVIGHMRDAASTVWGALTLNECQTRLDNLFVRKKMMPPPENLIWGVKTDWTLVSHPSDLGQVMKADECRYVGGSKHECMDFIEKNKPKIKYQEADHSAFDGKKQGDAPVWVKLDESMMYKPASETEISFAQNNGVIQAWVNGVEFLSPQQVKSRMEDAFNMARDKFESPFSHNKVYRFSHFDAYWNYHQNNLLLSKTQKQTS